MTKIALITGISGQDGFYLAELLLQKNYYVVGMLRDNNLETSAIKQLKDQIKFIYGDLTDTESLHKAIKTIQPDELYNLASQSSPNFSWQCVEATMNINGLGAQRLFEAVKMEKPNCRIYQASSSEMFGEVQQSPQDEQTPFNPNNPYAAAKVYAHHMARIYRERYNLFISCGILFNHESPLRGLHFITQKITYAAACIKLGIKNSSALNEQGEPIVKDGKVSLGNLAAERDWGFAGDYVKAMWLMLQQNKADDFVIGTGQLQTIEELCQIAFGAVGLDWKGYIHIDPRFIRPIETKALVADISKAKRLLGWEYQKNFKDLLLLMLREHLKRMSNDQKIMELLGG